MLLEDWTVLGLTLLWAWLSGNTLDSQGEIWTLHLVASQKEEVCLQHSLRFLSVCHALMQKRHYDSLVPELGVERSHFSPFCSFQPSYLFSNCMVLYKKKMCGGYSKTNSETLRFKSKIIECMMSLSFQKDSQQDYDISTIQNI